MSVFENIAFGMKIRKHTKADITAEVGRVGEILKLTDYLDRKPGQLSGGQRQRVAIGRAMVRNPDLFLFDEPLSNLDAKLRAEMRTEIKRIHNVLGVTIAYVTHDQVEAMTLADKIVLLNAGKIEQLGTPEELYMQPDTLFAARFIGAPQSNAIDAQIRLSGGSMSAQIGDIALPLNGDACRHQIRDGQRVILGVRPENLTLGDAGPIVTTNHSVGLCEPMGSETSIMLDFAGFALRMRAPRLVKLAAGSTQSVSWNMTGAHLFDPETGIHL
jgi:ABC-type sugar transport system ATPase subunit